MKLPLLLMLAAFWLVPNVISSQITADSISGRYWYQEIEHTVEFLILKPNQRFAYERKTTKEEDGSSTKAVKGLVGAFEIIEDKIIFHPTTLWIIEDDERERITDVEKITELAYMPKTMFMEEKDGQILLKINHEVWVKDE